MVKPGRDYGRSISMDMKYLYQDSSQLEYQEQRKRVKEKIKEAKDLETIW